MDNQESIRSAVFWVTNKFWQVGEFENMESKDEDWLYFIWDKKDELKSFSAV